MSIRIANISNLLKLLENGIITITSVQCKTKACADVTKTDNVTSTEFIESLQYLNEATLFRDGIGFYYEITGKNSIRLECGMKNAFLDEYFYVDCTLKDGTSTRGIEEKLRETVFNKMDEKIAV